MEENNQEIVITGLENAVEKLQKQTELYDRLREQDRRMEEIIEISKRENK